MPRRIAWLALLVATGCGGPQRGVVKPSTLDPALVELDGKPGRDIDYPVVRIDRFDGFLGEAARVEATIGLARRLGGELRAAVLDIAEKRELPRADRRAWTAVARDVSARDDLTDADRERLRKAAEPLIALLPHVRAVPGTADRLVVDGTALIAGAEKAAPDEAARLAPALDAANVALVKLREARARAPNLATEIRQGLDALERLAPPPTVIPATAEPASRPPSTGGAGAAPAAAASGVAPGTGAAPAAAAPVGAPGT